MSGQNKPVIYNCLASTMVAVLNVFRSVLDAEVGVEGINASYYHTALYSFMLGSIPYHQVAREVPIPTDFKQPPLKSMIVKGNVFLPHANMLILDHEWLDFEDFILDITLPLLVNKSLVKYGYTPIEAVLLQDKELVTTHFQREVINPFTIQDRFVTPIKLTTGRTVPLESYLKELIDKVSKS